MIAEVCREFSWSIEYVLRMPARRFFAVRKAMLEIISDERNQTYVELCDIQSISVCDIKYQSSLKEYYQSKLSGYKKRPSGRVFDVNIKEQREDLNRQLEAIFKQKKRLMGL